MAKFYKYKCRECIPRVRSMCIQEAQTSPGAKRIIERAFESHTDTEATWDLLQNNCLLLQRDQAVIGTGGRQQGGLLDRMRRQEDAPPAAEPQQQPPPPVVQAPPSPPPRDSLLSRMRSREPENEPPSAPVNPAATQDLDRKPTSAPEHVTVSPPVEMPTPAPPRRPATLLDRIRTEAEPRVEPRIEPQVPPIPVPGRVVMPAEPVRPTPAAELGRQTQVPEPHRPSALVPSPATGLRYPPVTRPLPMPNPVPGPKMLVAVVTGHRILLPENGDVVLGRLDPLTRIKPDIDLTYEDRLDRGISRMHASISGRQGRHELMDLGSNNGTWLNGERLPLERNPVLQVGDEVRLGSCALFFAQVPEIYQRVPPAGQYFLYCTFSGHFFPLPDKESILIGRADPALGYQPDIDLSGESDAASVVSRRHARLNRVGNEFLLEDLGSANKTKVDGRPIYVGTQVPILPGQHVWLGGCVLAFDVVDKWAAVAAL